MEADDGILAGLSTGKVWAEMSTTDEAEVKRLGAKVQAVGADPVDCPVSGGCHRAATGNIAIFAGCDRAVFDRLFAGADHSGTPRSAHRAAWLGIGLEGGDQLCGNGQPHHAL